MTQNELTKSWLNTDLKVTYCISRKQINTSPPTPKNRDLVNFRRLETSDYIFWVAIFVETKSGAEMFGQGASIYLSSHLSWINPFNATGLFL